MMERRKAPSVSFSSPDWLVLLKLSLYVQSGLERFARGRVLMLVAVNVPCLIRTQRNHMARIRCRLESAADIHGTADDIPLEDDSVDTILCTQVLEHVKRPWIAISEMHRVLRTDGALILTVPQYWPLHEEPHDYFRFTTYGLRSLLDDVGFTIVEMHGEGRGAIVAAQAINNAIFELGRNTLRQLDSLRALKRCAYAGINALGLASRHLCDLNENC